MEYIEKVVKLMDGSECVLKSPVKDDAEEMVEFLKIVAEETHYLTRYPEEVDIDVEKEKEIIEEINNSEIDVMIVAFINGEIVGNASVRVLRNRIKVVHRCGFGISIKEKYWNKGIGNILMKESIKMAKKMGYEQIELGVFSDNYKAQDLYKKYGFEVWGTIKNAFKLKDGTYCDEINMGKFL